jgi:membrane associated rhomboid family serine protease
LLTNIFLHGGWFHLLGNMLFLWVFADNIEATLGYSKFILFYLAGGILASLTHIVLNPMSEIPCVGASGAIAACLGAYLVMFPSSKIKVLFIFILTSFRVPAIFFLGFWIIQQFTAGIGAIQASTAQTDGVAYWAHIGGFVFGVVVGLMYRSKAKELVATA